MDAAVEAVIDHLLDGLLREEAVSFHKLVKKGYLCLSDDPLQRYVT